VRSSPISSASAESCGVELINDIDGCVTKYVLSVIVSGGDIDETFCP